VDHLWSPWRLAYVTKSEQHTGCVFCAARDLPESDSLVLFEGNTCYIVLNRYPYTSGHLMVVPKRHVATLAGLTRDEMNEIGQRTQQCEVALAGLTRDEMNEIGQRTQQCEVALTEAYRPHGFNVGVNLGAPGGAGVHDHVHLHVVPRWTGDANFMTVVGNTRVLPEELGASAARLRPIFARLTAAPAP
jgi:ATP adenylyltransferase